MHAVSLVLLVCTAFLASCRATCVGCQPALDPKRPALTAHAFEAELWELPAERAAQLHRPADPSSACVALVIDEDGLRKPLRELSARDPAVRHVRTASLEVSCGSRGLLPRRTDSAAARDWTDGLRLELGARPGADWAALVLDSGCAWTSPQGERLASASGSTPIPPDHDVLVW
jgi:hypothetical protein